MKIFGEGDNLWTAFKSNKSIAIAKTLYLMTAKNNGDPKFLEALSNFIIAHDAKDIGQFDHVHHWITGSLMKIYAQYVQQPEQSNWNLLRKTMNLFSSKQRDKFMRQ